MVSPMYPNQPLANGPSVFSPSSSGKDLSSVMMEHQRRQEEAQRQREQRGRMAKQATKQAKPYLESLFSSPEISMTTAEGGLGAPLNQGLFESAGSTQLAAPEAMSMSTPYSAGADGLFASAGSTELTAASPWSLPGLEAGAGAGAGAGGAGAAGGAAGIGATGIGAIIAAGLAGSGELNHQMNKKDSAFGYDRLNNMGTFDVGGKDIGFRAGDWAKWMNPMSWVKDPNDAQKSLVNAFTFGIFD